MPEPQFNPEQPFTMAPAFDPSKPFSLASNGVPLGAHPEARMSAELGPVDQAVALFHRAFPPERPRVDSNMVTVGSVGIAPEDALMAGQAVRGMAGAVQGAAGMAGKVAAGAKAAVASAAPAVKYEATKTLLERIGVPSPLAVAAAIAVSGYKKGAKVEPIEPTSPAASPASPGASAPVAPAPQGAVQSPPSESVPLRAVPPATSAPEPIPPARLQGNALPDQKALNEAALAARRAAYQARIAPPAPPTPKPGNVKLSVAETKAFTDLLKRGMSGDEALQNVLMQRELVARLGVPPPTVAQTKFPKGMRGKTSG